MSKIIDIPQQSEAFELGDFKYWWRDDGEDFLYKFNIYKKLKTVIHVELRAEVYDGEVRYSQEKYIFKYSKKHKCEYFKIGSTIILCKDFKKEK
jgi:hypothetical protein